MKLIGVATLVCALGAARGQDTLPERTRRYLGELVRLDTSNPPGNETRAAAWLKDAASREGIPCELLGGNPARLNFVARLKGSGARRPLLLMAHTDVVPARPAQWSAPPFSGELRDGCLYGRGALDDKSLLAACLSVMVELKRTGSRLARDIILLAEADEESGSSGIQWILRHARDTIDAEFALTEGGFGAALPGGRRVYHVQTAEKSPMPVVLRARGMAAHGSLPRGDNPLVRLSRAVVKLADAEQPVRLNEVTERYFTALSGLPEYAWLAPLLPQLRRPETALAAARAIRARDPEFDAQLHTTVSPDVMRGGDVVNVIPETAEARVDVRRLPNETRGEVLARLRRIVADPRVEIATAPGHNMPATAPSPLDTSMFRTIEAVLREAQPEALLVPYMQRGATDGSWLRRRGMVVYGVPLFTYEERENRSHAIDERISLRSLDEGTQLLLRIVQAAGS